MVGGGGGALKLVLTLALLLGGGLAFQCHRQRPDPEKNITCNPETAENKCLIDCLGNFQTSCYRLQFTTPKGVKHVEFDCVGLDNRECWVKRLGENLECLQTTSQKLWDAFKECQYSTHDQATKGTENRSETDFPVKLCSCSTNGCNLDCISKCEATSWGKGGATSARSAVPLQEILGMVIAAILLRSPRIH